MIDTSWKDNEVTFNHFNSDPAILLIPHIKVATPFQNEPYFFICMKMLLKKDLDLQKNI